jgi:hypothetical protein
MLDERLLPGETLTANYGWTLPDVGGSGNAWGGELNANFTSIDSILYSVQESVPAASSTTPVMDGTGAVGVSALFARADHVHPSDTSRYAASNPSGYQTAAQVTSALAPYAPLASPTFTGVPAGPTATAGTNTTQLATCAFVATAVGASVAGVSSFNTRTGAITLIGSDVTAAGGALLAGPTFTGTPSAPTASLGTSTTQLATTAFVGNANANLAPLASPTLSGVPTAPTASPGTASGQIATTGFVAASFAPLASPIFTGTVTIPAGTSGAAIAGVTNGSNAPAGQIGEWISAQQSTNQTMTSGTALNVTSISLTAGDWDVDGSVYFLSSGNVGSNYVASTSTTSATANAPGTPGRAQISTGATMGAVCLPTGRQRVNVSATTTIYLVGLATFGSGTCNAQGTIQARRMR